MSNNLFKAVVKEFQCTAEYERRLQSSVAFYQTVSLAENAILFPCFSDAFLAQYASVFSSGAAPGRSSPALLSSSSSSSSSATKAAAAAAVAAEAAATAKSGAVGVIKAFVKYHASQSIPVESRRQGALALVSSMYSEFGSLALFNSDTARNLFLSLSPDEQRLVKRIGPDEVELFNQACRFLGPGKLDLPGAAGALVATHETLNAVAAWVSQNVFSVVKHVDPAFPKWAASAKQRSWLAVNSTNAGLAGAFCWILFNFLSTSFFVFLSFSFTLTVGVSGFL